MMRVATCADMSPMRLEREQTQARSQDYAAFVHAHARLAYRVAYSLLRDTADAEDAVQETFLKLLRKDRWRAAQSERAFVARTAWRVALDLRSRSPKRHTESELPELPSRAPDPERQAAHAEENAQLHRLIHSLPDKLRQPLLLSALGELSSADVAAILNQPEGTVRRRVAEARALLREKLCALEVRHARRR